jgi:3-dehydroquinate synthetase
MNAATHLARITGLLSSSDTERILECVRRYGPIPSLQGVTAAGLVARLGADKKTIQGNVHFVLPETIGEVKILTGIAPDKVLAATEAALQ